MDVYVAALGTAYLLSAGGAGPLCTQQVKPGALDHEFETMYAKLGAWRDAYGTTIVPKQVRHHNFDLLHSAMRRIGSSSVSCMTMLAVPAWTRFEGG